MTRPIAGILALFLLLSSLPGCLIEARGPEVESAEPMMMHEDEPITEHDAELMGLLEDADARIEDAPPATRVGESALDHDHDHANCDHDHHHDHDHEGDAHHHGSEGEKP